MSTSIEELQEWMQASSEDEHLEFKEGKNQYDFGKLAEYCSAFANEGGGKLVFGVTDKQPRRVVGSQAFPDLGKIKKALIGVFSGLPIEVEDIDHDGKRVVVFHIPSRPKGIPIAYKGAYLERNRDSTQAMNSARIKRIHDELVPDFSAQICPDADVGCLSSEAIQLFRELWRRKSGNARLQGLDDAQLLEDADLLTHGRITNAALILLGTHKALRTHQLGQAEVIFEYRLNESSTHYDDRSSYAEGFFLFYNRLWETINLRNEVYQYQEGLFRRDIPSFNETVIREALLNAVTHRDYTRSGEVKVLQSPRKLEVHSPGGFLPGITPENILTSGEPRNKLIADTFEKCGLVERSGQGVNLMFELSIKESKPTPDYSGSDAYWVRLILGAEVQDREFVTFIEKVGAEVQRTLRTEDFLIFDYLRRGERVPQVLRERLPLLRDQGILEAIGYGKGTKYMLSKRLYGLAGRRGVYTRTRGLDEDTNKELLVKHITDNQREGSPLAELKQVLPSLPEAQVKRLLQKLKQAGRVHFIGRTRGARWYPGAGV